MTKSIKKIIIVLVIIIALVLTMLFITNARSNQSNEKQEVSSSNTFQITDFNIENRIVLKKDSVSNWKRQEHINIKYCYKQR